MTAPSLRTIEPAAVAREVVGLVVDHVARYVVPLSPGRLGVPTFADGAENCDLGMTVQDLVTWAQTGQGEPDDAMQAAMDVCQALYTQAGHPGEYGTGALAHGQAEPERAIDVVLLATFARHQLARGGDVTATALAALAGVSGRRLRQLVDAGEARKRARVGARGATTLTALQAQRLLATRVVGHDDAMALDRAGASWTFQHRLTRTMLWITGGMPVAAVATARGWDPYKDRADTWVRLVPGRDE